jgi:hypothetical protein
MRHSRFVVVPVFIISSISLLFFSCSPDEGNRESVSGFQYPSIAQLNQIGAIGQVSDELFARPNRVVPLDGERFIIADIQRLKLHLFDAGMNHLHTFGRSGEGPGEFQRFSEIIYENGQLRIYDGRAYKVMDLAVRENQIELIRESEFTFFPLPDFPGAMFWRFAEGRDSTHLAIYRDFNIQSQASPRFTRFVGLPYDEQYSPDGDEPAFVFNNTAEVEFRNGILTIPYYQRGFIALSKGRVYYATNDEPEIGVYNIDGRQTGIMQLPDTRVPLSQDEKVNVYEQFYRNSPDPDLFRGEVLPLIPDQRPVIRAMSADAQGRIWVRIYTVNDSDPDWLVLDADGSPLTMLSMPDGHTFRNAFGNTLFTGFNSEEGPRVAVHELDML